MQSMQVCVTRKEGSAPVHVGNAVVSEFYAYPLSEFVQPAALHTSAPTRQYAYVVSEFCFLGLHWGEITADGNAIVSDFNPFFTKGMFSKVLSFWINRDGGYVTAWAFSSADPAPTLMAVFKVETPIDMAMVTRLQYVHLYILYGPHRKIALDVYDVTTPVQLDQVDPLKHLDGDSVGFVEPCCMVLVYPEGLEEINPLVLVLDTATGYIHLFDQHLNPVLKTNNLDGMRHAFMRPVDLYCLQGKEIRNGSQDGAGSGVDPAGQADTLRDCFVAEQGIPRIVHFRVSILNRTLSLVSEYTGDGTKDGVDTNLKTPSAVVAHHYQEKTLVYVAEVRAQGGVTSRSMHMLTDTCIDIHTHACVLT